MLHVRNIMQHYATLCNRGLKLEQYAGQTDNLETSDGSQAILI